ncbi:LLM class flavin-dependent oxidoreductase [Mycolicibacterium pulveris]|uniref:Phthiodiolone/phenolphthiodiolone dimycocerosates ketoreductase n=1 Tax=Mycolicibacterium pulveris TaxID=36813 RepID=A0A7I7UMZ2_MYCPV|nr:LLM class flavin-dependent oxidoreductase [Mycolicibacterium pulveris]MCV6981328.1 LLM class flavin-dependent oxidoreductase [Mycolicibacterium pulveris]BBY82223.1 phthiodiolone/phenolphthiodiolone dimycocerosates ketoreductase [Mycolicibacterium pulveris]
MKVSLLVTPMHPMVSIQAMLAVAEEAKADSVWLPDHLLGCAHPALWPEMAMAPVSPDADAWYDPFACLAVLGQLSDIPMGVCVTDAIRRQAPDTVRSTLTLHHLCRGGFHLGIGAGEAENLIPFGYDFSTPVKHLEAMLPELRALLDFGTTCTGGAGRVGLPLRRDDIGAPKLWIGAHGPRMLRLTGEYGDGWIPAWPMSPSTYGERRDTIAGHAARSGRPMPECALQVNVIVGENRDHVSELMERDPLGKLAALMCSAEIWAKYGLRHPSGPECRGLVDLVFHDLDPDELRELAPRIPIELVEELMFVGNATEIAERVSGYAANGLEHTIVASVTGIVGGIDEIASNTDQLIALFAALRELAPR